MTRTIELKHYYCSDIEDIENWKPEHNNIIYPLTLTVGLSDEAWGESYWITIATPEALENLPSNSYLFNNINKFILLERYCWQEVITIIKEKIAEMEVFDFYDWLDIHEQLAQSFHAEYEDVA